MSRIKIGRTRKWFGRPIYRTTAEIPLGDGTVIPAGFETDLVSSPAVVKWLLPNDHLEIPAIKHDFRRKHRPDLSLWKTDLAFLDDMHDANVAEPARTLCWLATRLNKNRS